jgi:hypothetical protein
MEIGIFTKGVSEVHNVLGRERVVNGGFDVNANWVLGDGWDIVGGVLVDVGLAGTFCAQLLPAVRIGQSFKISYDVRNYIYGEVFVYLAIVNCYAAGNGRYCREGIFTLYDYYLYIQNVIDSNMQIDNVSVKYGYEEED